MSGSDPETEDCSRLKPRNLLEAIAQHSFGPMESLVGWVLQYALESESKEIMASCDSNKLLAVG